MNALATADLWDYEELKTVSFPASVEELRERAYLDANPDVDRIGVSAHYHFTTYGPGRAQLANAGEICRLRERKMQRVQFRREPVEGGHPFNFIDDATAARFDIQRIAPAMSSSDYNAEMLGIIRSRPDDLLLDLGAGLPRTYHSNVVTAEIFPLTTTDVVCIGEDLPFADDTFDLVFCIAVLEHVRHPWLVAKEIMRVLRPGGTAFVEYPFIAPVHAYPHHYFNATAQGLASLFADADAVSLNTPAHLAPIFGLQWMLANWKAGLPPDEAERFGKMNVDELIAPPTDQWNKPYCVSLRRDAADTIAAGTRLVATKRAHRD